MTVTTLDVPRSVGKAFGRRCVITVEPRHELKPDKYTKGQATQPVIVIDTAQGSGLRVRFKFVKPAIWTPNTGTLEVFNLAPESRARLQDKNTRVTILAGYGNDLKVVGILSARQVNHKHEGPDWITKFEGGDGGRSFWHGRVSKSFASGTPVAEAAKEMLGALGKFSGGAEALLKKHTGSSTFKHGKAFHGRTVNEVRAILAQFGLEHTIQDEEVILYPKDGTTKDVYVIGPDSGLIGSPEYASPPHPGKPKLLKIRTLMIPELRQRSMIQLRSEAHTGNFVLREVTHSGDTHGADWFSDQELSALKGAK